MTTTPFNPFEDRLSRDIRNDLSEAFSEAVETGSDTKLLEVVNSYLDRHLAPHYLDYIDARYQRYQQALETIKKNKIAKPIAQAVVLWNLGLFFEVHEVLEHAWYNAKGNMKATLQALIRAAGVYIKSEYGFVDSAARIAAKATPVLESNRDLLIEYFDPQTLINALQSPFEGVPVAPKLQ
jgi:hypothetical protein